jgi:hypothetical protein
MAMFPASVWSKPTATGTANPNNIQGITPDTWFSPLQPLPSFAPDDVQGRQWDFPVGYNTLITPRPMDKITAKMLRDLVCKCDIISVILNNRKDQVESLEWVIRPKDGKKQKKVKKDAAEDPRIQEMTDFWKSPDKVNSWDQWLRPLLEDLFVIDAPTVYIRKNMAGGIYGVEVVDGATIALNVDQNGRRPLPPSPAFKQILKGVPAVSYTTDQLIYAPRNMRSWGIYGRSPIEQTMVTINAAINRAQFNMSYYTEGNIPDAIASLPDNFTPAQAAAFTEWWDSMYSGNLAQKRKVKFIPGMKSIEQLKEPEMKNVYDDYIARLLCFAMGISPQPFISQMNRATAEVSKVSTDEEGKVPVQNWVKNLVNKVIQGPQFFNYPDLEFDWQESEDTDPAQQMTILTGYTGKALMTINESRERIGLEPDPNPMCDELGIVTASGFVTLEQAQAQAEATLEQTKNPPMSGGEGGTDGESQSLGADSSRPAPAKKGLKKNSGIHTRLTRKSVVAAKARTKKAVYDVLVAARESVKRQLEDKLAKADTVEIDLSALDGLDDATRAELAAIAGESGTIILGHISLSEENLVNQVNDRAVTWAAERSAQLVTMVSDSTRTALQRIISQGLEDNVGRDQIIEDITGLDSTLFSEDRAELIANTEIGNANSEGSLMGLKEAEDAGVNVKKEWDAADEPCPVCQENADAGPIPIDEDFPSGDSAPLAHPHCMCVLVGVTSD